MRRCLYCMQPAGARSCCSPVIARCASGRRSCCGGSGRRCRFRCWSKATGRAKSLLTKFREYGNAVLLGTSSFWEGVDVKGAALSRRHHRQAAVRCAGRSGAQGAAGRDRAARRQPVLRRADSAGGDRAEAGRRPADARSERFRRDHAVRSAFAHARLRQDLPRQSAADAAHREARRSRAVPVRRSLRISVGDRSRRRRRAGSAP